MQDLSWHKKTMGDILGEDRGIGDYVAMRVGAFRPEVLEELRVVEREAATREFSRAARAHRDQRQPEHGGGDTRPELEIVDIEAGLRAARAALELFPAAECSEKAIELLGDCDCPHADNPEF